MSAPTPPVHLVVGAAGGIGSVLCDLLRERGAAVVPAGRRVDGIRAIAADFGTEPEVLDAREPGAVEAAARRTVERLGRLDGIVNLAGSILLKPAHRTSHEEWRETLAQNLDTAFECVRAGAATMARGGGSIVLMSSAAARVGLANHDAIAAAKAGVEGLARSAAASYASRGLRVNVVAPGLVRTPLAANVLASEASEKASVAMHPLGRLGEPRDVAEVIAWLLDPATSWVTGQVVGVDGGLGTLRAR
ncbi:MAG: SDR family oxidoreductase [Planctomycetota bacterium]